MAISETQLETWSKQGSITQSKDTYSTIRTALLDNTAGYASKEYEIFLQGSYGNDTNIFADSDVDIVMKLNSTYYYDLSELSIEEQNLYKSHNSAATYGFDEFKSDVILLLNKKYGNSVKPGNKAILIESSGNRRKADVLAAVQFRRYLTYNNVSKRFIEGLCFWNSNNEQIINYPKFHSANCTTKHQQTSSWFKPSVRILKNMRNAMVAKGYLQEGIAPSYFLEGMLYNVPNGKFGTSYSNTISSAINWIIDCDRTKLLCANEQYYLLHQDSPVTWRKENLQAFLDATVKFWSS